jgi:hypothetical protein
VARRQVYQLDAPAGEKGVGADEQRVGTVARKSREGPLDLPAGAGVKDLDLQSDGAGSRLHVSQRGFDGNIRRIDEHGNASSSRYQITQEFQPLCRQLTQEKIDACQVAARPGEAGDKTELHRVFGDQEDDGDRRGFRRSSGKGEPYSIRVRDNGSAEIVATSDYNSGRQARR